MGPLHIISGHNRQQTIQHPVLLMVTDTIGGMKD